MEACCLEAVQTRTASLVSPGLCHNEKIARRSKGSLLLIPIGLPPICQRSLLYGSKLILVLIRIGNRDEGLIVRMDALWHGALASGGCGVLDKFALFQLERLLLYTVVDVPSRDENTDARGDDRFFW